jgi:exo-beta-1,3-glucanase (GH17 family)
MISVYQGYKNLIIGIFISNMLFSQIAVSDETISDLYLGDNWVHQIQTSPQNNYRLENGDLLLGNQDYQSISFSGYRLPTRGENLPNKNDYCPTVAELKEDMHIMAAMGIKLLRTYDTQFFDHATRLLEAISQLKQANPDFEMYVMLGAWIQCEGAYTDKVDHTKEDEKTNIAEMNAAIELAAKYPDIVKIIAVGNEAMVTWQAHWVSSEIILKYVQYAKGAKTNSINGHLLPKNVLLTSSDNFAVWGAEEQYRKESLTKLLNEIDFISLHTYPFHDTHWNPGFWQLSEEESNKSPEAIAHLSMSEAFERAVDQYNMVKDYLEQTNIIKPIHIGETGWATLDDHIFTTPGSGATDEIKMKLYYDAINKWAFMNNISCSYFEAFNEPWKGGELGSESHFGLFTVGGKAKYVLWSLVDNGTFDNVTRGGKPITKTYNGNLQMLFKDLLLPPIKKNIK